MACQGINSWTLSELVASFLDLSIAYCLLCASAFSYLASKFLGLFGLCLPCPCDGLFWNPRNNSHCLQRQLLDCPYEKISLVRSAARTKTPLETLWTVDRDDRNQVRSPDLKLASDENREDENNKLGSKEEEEERDECGVAKGKRVVGRRFRHGLRRRRKLSSVSSYDTLRSDARNSPRSPPSIAKNGNEVSEDAIGFEDYGLFERASLSLELDDLNERTNKLINRRSSQIEEFGVNDKSAKNTVRVLERALEDEHVARSALYVELGKERSAAASAADEAMAMISRLQEEKASIEMESRQYHRVIEAKAAYDTEEMNILKEILLRREKEIHFLEREVEAYRQTGFENDPMNEPVKSLNRTIAFEKELAVPELDDEPSKEVDADESSKNIQFAESKDPPPNFAADSDSRVYDVHVIDSATVTRKFVSSSFSGSEVSGGLPPPGGNSRGKARAAELRRNSMSAFDCERVKIDDEVEWLRGRLRVVQEGREKLKFTGSHKEREKLQLQLLEDIAGQLREIRQLNEPGKAERQASLPLSYSKVTSKKRCWRSASLNINQST